MSMIHDIGILLHIKVSNLYWGVLTNRSMTHEYEDVEVCNFDLMDQKNVITRRLWIYGDT